MKTNTILFIIGFIMIVLGITLVVIARLLVGQVSWGARWVINAVGWILIGGVIVPICDEIKRSK